MRNMILLTIGMIWGLWSCISMNSDQEDIAVEGRTLLTPVGPAVMVQRVTIPCFLRTEADQVCTEAGDVRSCRRPAWAALQTQERATFIAASYFNGTNNCIFFAAANGGTCIPPTTLTPILEKNPLGTAVFDCGGFTRDTLIATGAVVNERFSFFNEVVAYVEAPATLQPE